MPAVKKKKKATKNAGVDVAGALAAFGERARRFALAGAGGLLVVGAAALGVMWAGGYLGAMSDGAGRLLDAQTRGVGLAVARVLVVGREETDPHELLEAAGPLVGASILSVDLDAVRARVETLGWVRAAAVRRLLPDTIQISIVERAPSAVWQKEGSLSLVDQSGAIIREIGAYEYAHLPLIVGAGAPEAAAQVLDALSQHPELKKMTAALVRVSKRRWNMRLRNGVDIKLPDEEMPRALATLAELQSAQRLLDQPLEYIDLLDPERMVVRRKGEPAPATAEAVGERS